MNMLKATFLTVAVLGVMMSTGDVLAQHPEESARLSFGSLLSQADKDRDGKLSREEFSLIWKDKNAAEKRYRAWDRNEDGFITEDEYVTTVVEMGRRD